MKCLMVGSPLDYAGLVRAQVKSGEHVSEIVVNRSGIHERDERSFAMVHRLRPIIQKNCEGLIPQTSSRWLNNLQAHQRCSACE